MVFELSVLQGCRTIPLTRGLNALIDEADFDQVSQYNWHALEKPRRAGPLYYAYRCVPAGESGPRSLQAFLVCPASGMVGDHKNGDPRDNRRANLREATVRQNIQNRHYSHGTSKYKGVSLHPGRDHYRVTVNIDGKPTYVGSYADERDAAVAYDRAAREHYKEFAMTNEELYGDIGDANRELVPVKIARQGPKPSKYRGVGYEKNKDRWYAEISIGGGKHRKIGRFYTERDAARAYDVALLARDGPDAQTNAKRFGDLDPALDEFHKPPVRKPYGASKYRGVSYNKTTKRWQARVYIGNGKTRTVGTCHTEKDAAIAFDRAERELRGDKATTNAQLYPDDFHEVD